MQEEERGLRPRPGGGLGPSSEVETERRDREPGAAAGDMERRQSCPRRQGEGMEPGTAAGDREVGQSQALPQETGRGDRPRCPCRRQGEGMEPGAAAGTKHPWLENVASGRSSYGFIKGEGLLAGLGLS